MVMKTTYLHRQMDFFTFLMLFDLCIQLLTCSTIWISPQLEFPACQQGWTMIQWKWTWSLSVVPNFATARTVGYQAPPSMVFSRQEYWSGLPFTSPGDLPNPEIEPGSSTLQTGTLPSEPPGKSIPESYDKRHWKFRGFSLLQFFFWTLNQWNLYLREVPPSLPKNTLIWVRSDTG